MALSVAILQSSVGATGGGAVPLPSASFTPPAGSILFAVFGVLTFYSAVDPTPFMSISDSTGLVWAPVGTSGDTISFSSGIAVYRAVVGPAPVPMTVTGALGGGLASSEARLSVLSYTSFDPLTPVAQILANSRGAGFPSNDGAPAWSFNMVAPPLPTQEIVSVILTNGSTPATATPGAGWTLLDGPVTWRTIMAIETRRGSGSSAVDWLAGSTVPPAYKNNGFSFAVSPLGGGGSASAFIPAFIPGL